MTRAQKTLVADDSDLQADILESTLNDLGIEDITKTENGALALEHFKEALQSATPYSLVFLDIVMPEMDGQEALRRMRALERDAGISKDGKTTIIMTTSLDSPKDMIEALIEGDCTDYIVKPVDEANLRWMLAKYGFLGD
jgi:two-component system chemotaxis response regulator CheY